MYSRSDLLGVAGRRGAASSTASCTACRARCVCVCVCVYVFVCVCGGGVVGWGGVGGWVGLRRPLRSAPQVRKHKAPLSAIIDCIVPGLAAHGGAVGVGVGSSSSSSSSSSRSSMLSLIAKLHGKSALTQPQVRYVVFIGRR